MSEKTSLAPINGQAVTKRKPGRPSKHTLEEKHKALRAYLVEGTFLKAEQVTGIDQATIRSWIKTDWWKEAEEKYRQELEEQYRTRGTKIILKAQDAIIDRLENGDTYIGKDGKERKRPVSMREATFAYGVTYDKMRVSLEKPTEVIKTDAPVQAIAAPTTEQKDWLQELAQRFIQATQIIEAKTIEGKVVQVDANSQRQEAPQSSQPEVSRKDNEESGGH